MPDPGPPPEPPAMHPTARRPPAWTTPPENPTTPPNRSPARVDAEVERAERQRAELTAEMQRTGQADALVVAGLDRVTLPGGRACTSTTWIEGRITVLPRADTVVLFTLPTSVDGNATQMTVRWDVLARVCGRSCWQRVPDLDPPRWITRRWPSATELEVLRGLALPTR